MTSTSALLLLADQLRARSAQREIGWSDIGGCRRRTRYKIDGYEPVNRMSSVTAMIGTAVHEQLKTVLDALGMPAEWEVEYADIKGHFDRYEPEHRRVVDTKTTTSRWLESIKLHGPPFSHIWQCSGYCAALLTQDPPVPVETFRIDYLCRDTGEEWQYEQYFSMRDIRDALEWLDDVKSVPFDLVPRDYEPDSAWCQGCPFGGPDGGLCWSGGVPERDRRSVLLAEGAEAGQTADDLFQTRKQIKDLKAKEVRLKGILDGLRPDDTDVVIQAGDRYLSWSPTSRGWQLRFTSPPQKKPV